jgi:hypothetical protein
VNGQLVSWIVLVAFFMAYNLVALIPATSVDVLTSGTSLVYLSICTVFLLRVLALRQRSNFVNAWVAFLGLNALSFVMVPEANAVYAGLYTFEVITIFKTILMVSLSLFPFYFLARKKIISDGMMAGLFFMLLTVFVIRYVYDTQWIRLEEGDGHQINEIYGIVYLLPFLFFVKHRPVACFLLLFMLILVISSLKRGAFLTFSIGSATFLYCILRSAAARSASSAVVVFALAAALVAVGVLLVLGNEVLINRLMSVGSDGGSNRDFIIETLGLALLTDTSGAQLVLGHGFAGTVPYVYTFAHNDLLEVIFNYGMVGLVIYLVLWKRLFGIVKDGNLPSSYRMALAAILLMWIVDSQYHRFFSGAYSIPAVMVLGYVLGKLGSKELSEEPAIVSRSRALGCS